MLLKLIRLPIVLIRLYNEATRCRFGTLRGTLEAFRILLVLNALKTRRKRKEYVTVRIFGLTVHAYDYRTVLNLFNEIFINGEYDFVASCMNPKILDCGANIGFATLFFKLRYPESQIVCFEPNPLSFKLLERNILENGLTNVQLVNKAVSNEAGRFKFSVGEEMGSVVASFSGHRNKACDISVDAVPLSHVIGLQKFDLAKIDVEGAEHLVIDDLLQNHKMEAVSEFMIEYHHMADQENCHLGEFLQKVEKCDFLYNVRAKYRRRGSYQDLFLHLYKKGR